MGGEKVKRILGCFILLGMLVFMCATAVAQPHMELVDTQQIPEDRSFRGGFPISSEGKIVMTDIKGSKKSSKPWIGFYGKMENGTTFKVDLEFADGNIQVCALYKGNTPGRLDRKYVLRESLPANNKWRYPGTFSLDVVDDQATIKLGNKSYVWPGVSMLTGEMEVGRVSGKLEVYNYVRE